MSSENDINSDDESRISEGNTAAEIASLEQGEMVTEKRRYSINEPTRLVKPFLERFFVENGKRYFPTKINPPMQQIKFLRVGPCIPSAPSILSASRNDCTRRSLSGASNAKPMSKKQKLNIDNTFNQIDQSKEERLGALESKIKDVRGDNVDTQEDPGSQDKEKEKYVVFGEK